MCTENQERNVYKVMMVIFNGNLGTRSRMRVNSCFSEEFEFKVGVHQGSVLKVVSGTFLLVCFLSLNESTCQTRKNVFYFTLKALFVLKKINF